MRSELFVDMLWRGVAIKLVLGVCFSFITQTFHIAMPITPLHFGPGMLIRAGLTRAFSLRIFCFAQVVTDLEVIANLLLGRYPIHNWFHTYIGAIASAAIGIILGRPICSWASQKILPLIPEPQIKTDLARPIGLAAAATGALVGTYSHVFFDSIMHPDIRPFSPFSLTNSLLGIVSVDNLGLFCGFCMLVAVAVYFRTKFNWAG